MPNTVLDRQDIVAAKSAVTAYKNTCDPLFKQLTDTIGTLRAAGFIGDASVGFNTFYTTVQPALSTNLTGDSNSVTALLTELLTAVERALIGTVDPELKTANEGAANAGGNSAGN
jgi:hypothetical protein